MTDNTNIIKEALEAGIAIIDEPGVLLPYHKQKAIEKMCNALALIEKGQEIRYRFPQSVIDDLKSAVKIFGSLSAEQDEQLGLKGGGYMSLESLLRRAESLPEGQEMWAVENPDGVIQWGSLHCGPSLAMSELADFSDTTEEELERLGCAPVKVLVTKKED